MEKVDLQKACELLLQRDNFVIFTHQKPDGDTVGSAFALMMILRSAGKNAAVFNSGDIPEKYGYFTAGCPQTKSAPDGRTLVAVDIASPNMLTTKAEPYKDEFYLSIDHHAFCTPFANYNYTNPSAAATCEIIYEIAKALNTEITKPLAAALYTGIATDTGCFLYSNATPLTHRIAADLIECGIDFAEINRKMFESKTAGRINLEKEVWQTLEISHNGLIATVIATSDMFKKAGAVEDDFEGLTSITRSVEGVKIGITLRETEKDVYKCSLRSYPPIESTAIAAAFGGGGHLRAAGCTVKGELTKVKEKLLAVCKQELKKQGLL